MFPCHREKIVPMISCWMGKQYERLPNTNKKNVGIIHVYALQTCLKLLSVKRSEAVTILAVFLFLPLPSLSLE